MATPYSPPEWGEKGTNAFGIYLDVIKSGSLVETLSLPLDEAKSFVVAGRMEPLCDLVLQHPSISRVHAVLQFDSNGALFVKDMKSSHGTFVNKKRINAMEFQRLHVGDLLVFGESTRKYAVCGPEELMPEEPDREKLRAKIQAKKKAEQRRKEDEESGASWGFREDAEEEEDEDSSSDEEGKPKSKKGGDGDEDLPEYLRGIKEHGRSAYETSVRKTDVSEKDQKLFTQLQNRISKMENLETEKERILAKQNNLQGLSEGQEKTLQRNNERIKSLRKEIEDLEERIHARNAQREQTKASNASSKTKSRGARRDEDAYGYDSDEDDFYDRTSANQRKLQERQAAQQPAAKAAAKKKEAGAGEVLTAEIIQRKIKMLESNLAEVEAEYTRVAADTTDDKDGEEEVDALEAFMQSTAKELHAKELARLVTRREEIEKQLSQQRQLLVIAMPALSSESVAKANHPAASHAQKPHEPVDAEKLDVQSPVEPDQPRVSVVNVRQGAIDDVKEAKPSEDNGKEKKPSGEEKRALAPEEEAEAAKPKKRRLLGPTLPPPPSGPEKPKASTRTLATATADAAVLEGGDRVWVPPANQTGDGRTKLNDKFGY